eukprot:scaffold2428_cov75-Attheya_sp.AAC.1
MMKPLSKHHKPGHGARITDCTRSAEHNIKTAPPDIKPKTPHAPYPPLPNLPPSADWMSKLKHIHKPSSIPITCHPSMTRISKDTKQGSKHANSFEPLADEDGDVSMEQPPIVTPTTNNHAPSSLSKPPHCKKICNAKSKRKSMNDDLDKAAASDLMIVDPPSTSKPPSKTTKPRLNPNQSPTLRTIMTLIKKHGKPPKY